MDKDIETVFDMVLGDYMGAIAGEPDVDEETFESMKRGLVKLGKLAGIDPKKYDVDNLLN